MMQTMMDFSTGMLNAIAVFLASEPIIYLFGLVLLCFIVKVVKILIT